MGVARWALVAATLAVAGCSGPGVEVERGTAGFVQGFFGGVAADEPRAALVGRDILAVGGNAVDAATAVYFALSVTLPSHASLGGGGVCMVHDEPSKTTESLEFLARPAASVPAGADRPSGIPGNPRGFFLMHAKYGLLRWEQVLSPAEGMARFGIDISRTLARDLQEVEAPLMADEALRNIFGARDGGGLLKEGAFVRQVDLAATLGRMRVQGPGEFYVGQTARSLVAAVNGAGGSLSLEDLRNYAPAWGGTVSLKHGNLTVHAAPPPVAGGVVAAQMWGMLAANDRYEDADADGRAHLLAETAMRAFADRAAWMGPDGASSEPSAALAAEQRLARLSAGLDPAAHVAAASLQPPPVERPENPAATSFVVVDRDGSAVACGITLNNLFGTGRVAPGTGIVIAARPDDGGRGAAALGPVMAVNEFTNQLYLAIAASGGMTAPTALASVVAETMMANQPLDAALAHRRVHHGGAPDLLYYEEGIGRDILDSLLARGHRIAPVRSLGRVNAALCPEGLPSRPQSCAIETDPRGSGLSVSADR